MIFFTAARQMKISHKTCFARKFFLKWDSNTAEDMIYY